MNKKIIYIVLAALLLVAIIISAVKGLRVGLIYGEGTELSFSLADKDVSENEVKEIAKQVFPNNKFIIQRIEYFTNSALVKVDKADVTQEEIDSFKDKINEKYNEKIESGNIEVNHVQNVKLRTIVEPYVGPLGLSLLVILGYFAVRYKGTKEMLSLIKFLAIFEALLFCVYAICRVPVNGVTMPLFTLVFFGTIIGQTIVNEFKAKED